jgi:hypothetical protein
MTVFELHLRLLMRMRSTPRSTQFLEKELAEQDRELLGKNVCIRAQDRELLGKS